MWIKHGIGQWGQHPLGRKNVRRESDLGRSRRREAREDEAVKGSGYMHQGIVQGKQETHRGWGAGDLPNRLYDMAANKRWDLLVLRWWVFAGGVATRVSSRCDADALPCSFSTLDGPRCSACPPVRRPPDPYPLLFVAAADGAGRADMREDPLVRWVCSGVVRCRTSGSQDGRYLRAMPICASGLVCSRCRRRCRDSRESRPGARRVSLPPRASAQLNAGVETATVDGMGCDGDGRETGFDGSTNSQVSTWRVPFQRRELDGGRQGVGTEFRGLWRVRGRRGQPAAATAAGRCTGAPLRAALFHAPNWERRPEPQMGGGLQLGPPPPLYFWTSMFQENNLPFCISSTTDRQLGSES